MNNMGKRLFPLSDHVWENLVELVTDTLNTVTEDNFDTRREYLGYVAELSEMLDALRKDA